MKHSQKIAILGGGNLGIAIVEGLLKSNSIPPVNISITRRRVELIGHLREKGIHVSDDNKKAVSDADIILLTVKPHQAETVLKEIKLSVSNGKQILVSAVTGFSIEQIAAIAGTKCPIVRIMPNTAVAIGESVTCMACESGFEKERLKVSEFLSLLGKTLPVSEELMEAATVLGACGIAFALRFLRAMTQGGIEIGFSAETAQYIASQTLRGAAGLILEKGQHPEREIDKVTTPMGITISGLNEMEHNGFSSSLIKGLLTSYNKIAATKEKK
jgi:pyrroline-5-carboxylate reductase